MNRKIRSIAFSVLSLFFVLLLNAQYAWANERPPHSASQHDHGEGKPTLLSPRAHPNVLAVGQGKVDVLFTVQMAGRLPAKTAIFLRRVGDQDHIAMSDDGKESNLIAKDRTLGAYIPIDTAKLNPDSCEKYEVVARIGYTEATSPTTKICVSSFPVRAAASDTAYPLVLQDGSQAVADEVIISVRPDTNADEIRRLANNFNAKVVGSILPHNLYQLKLPAAVSASRMLELLSHIRTYPEVEAASPNGIGSLAGVLPNGSQHGLKQVLEYDTWAASAKGVWDSGAVGNNVTVVVLDSGINRQHPDFGSPGSCQLAENDCGLASTDFSPLNHGTMVAGIIAASGGAAGVAQGIKIHSIQIGSYFAPNYTITLFQMIDSFDGSYTNSPTSISNSAKGYIASHPEAKIINASFYGGPWGGVYSSLLTQLCTAINNTVLSGTTPVAVVVNAAGNKGANDNYYPARCNDHPALTRKELFITVANSSSVSGSVTDTTYLDTVTTQTTSLAIDQRYPSSNFGAWVDIAAPGVQIYTTASGSGYASPIGTSFSSPFVAGATAILYSCGVPLDQIQTTLRNSANVTVPFPDGSSAPRLDIYRALQYVNHAPSAMLLSNNSLNDGTNTTGGLEVGTLTRTDPDTCDKHTYTIAGGADAASFSIGGTASDRLRLTAGVLNYATKSSYTVIVQVKDFFGATFNQTLTVNVAAVNHAPTISNQTFHINEGSANGTAVATVVASDPDSGNVLTYSITAGNTSSAFSINASTGVLSVNNATALVYATNPAFNLTVTVTDGGGLSASATVTVNVNKAPTISNQLFSINEGTANGASIGAVNASDAGDTLIYSITAGNSSSAFSINSSTGVISVSNSGALVYATNPSFSLTVWVTDSGGLTASATVTVNVNAPGTPANNAPVIANQTFVVDDDSANGTAVGSVVAGDPDAGDSLSYSITGGNTGGAFALNATTGALTVSNALSYTTTPTYALTVRVADNGGLSTTATVTVNVNAASAPPPDPANPPGNPTTNPPASSGGGGGGCAVMPVGVKPDLSLVLVVLVLLGYGVWRRWNQGMTNESTLL